MLLEQRRLSKNKELDKDNQRETVEESSRSDREILASVKSSVSNPLQKAMIQRDYDAGIPLDIIKNRYKPD